MKRGTLRRTATKAIDNNQAEEMANDMKAKADSDFSRLSRGHADWSAIIHGLESHDKTALRHVH